MIDLSTDIEVHRHIPRAHMIVDQSSQSKYFIASKKQLNLIYDYRKILTNYPSMPIHFACMHLIIIIRVSRLMPIDTLQKRVRRSYFSPIWIIFGFYAWFISYGGQYRVALLTVHTHVKKITPNKITKCIEELVEHFRWNAFLQKSMGSQKSIIKE